MQMCVIEFVDRPDKPLYHLEHFIEGNYIKYNSNSGFVEDSLRYTPQVRQPVSARADVTNPSRHRLVGTLTGTRNYCKALHLLHILGFSKGVRLSVKNIRL